MICAISNKVLPWLILATAAMSVIFLGGKRRAFGIFVAQLHAEFNTTSLAELNWIGDSYAAVGYLTTTLTTSMILAIGRRYWASQLLGAFSILLACITSAYVPNPHWLFLTHTILHGIGSSLVLSTCGLVVNEHFDKNHRYHILATTLVSGGSVASILFVEFYAILVDDYGWRITFLILGIIYFVILLCGSLVFRKNSGKNESHGRTNKYTSITQYKLHSVQKILLLLWTIDRIVTSIVTYGMLLNLTDYMYRRKSSLQKSVLLTTLFAAGEASTYLIGALISGFTEDFLKNRLKYVLMITSLIMAIGLIVWEFVASHAGLSAFLAFVCGFCLGPSVTFLFPAGEEMTMLPGHLAYPFSLGGMGIGMSLSPLLSALIAQMFNYQWFFFAQGVLMLTKFMCLVISTGILNDNSARDWVIYEESTQVDNIPNVLDDECANSDEASLLIPGSVKVVDSKMGSELFGSRRTSRLHHEKN